MTSGFETWLRDYHASGGAVSEEEPGHSRPFCYAVHGGWRLIYRVRGNSRRQVLEHLNALLPPGARNVVWDILDEPTVETVGHWCGTLSAQLPQSWGDAGAEITP